jgi:hypothetical protein
LPSENWFDLLAFVPRRKLAQIMAWNGNRQFAKIVQTFLHEYGQIKLDSIAIVRPFVEHPNGGLRVRVKYMDSWLRFKLADSQIPANIKDFKTVKLRFAPFFTKSKEIKMLEKGFEVSDSRGRNDEERRRRMRRK